MLFVRRFTDQLSGLQSTAVHMDNEAAMERENSFIQRGCSAVTVEEDKDQKVVVRRPAGRDRSLELIHSVRTNQQYARDWTLHRQIKVALR